MDALRWHLFALICTFKVPHPEASSWTINVPSSVEGLLGSCVVIPCTFNYPNTEKTINGYTGIWLDEADQTIFHPESSQMKQKYQGRTQLLGDLRQKNCSFKINRLTHCDGGPFHFRIEMQNYENYSYRTNPVTVTVMNAPVDVKVESKSAVKEGESLKLNCTSDANPTSSYEWHSDNGTLLHKGNVYTVSNVSRHTGALYCTAINKIGRKKSGVVQLNVLYGPEIMAFSSCSSEGASVKCVCMAESSPLATVHFLLPNAALQSIKVERHGAITIGTLQADASSFDLVYCVANNTLGTTNVTLALAANSKVQNLYIVIGAGVGVIVAALLIVGIKKWNSREHLEEVPESHMTTMMEPPKHSSAAREYVQNKTYDHMYGNMEVGCSMDEAIYGNI